MNLKGARIVLTGAAGGIGAAAAARLAATGAGLILVGRDRGRLDYCARRLEATGAAVMAVAADLTSEAGRRAVVKVAGSRTVSRNSPITRVDSFSRANYSSSAG